MKRSCSPRSRSPRADRIPRVRTVGTVQRGRPHHGPLARCHQGRGGREEALPRQGGKLYNPGGQPLIGSQGLHQPDPRRRNRRRGYGRLRRQPRRLHRRQRAEARRGVESCWRQRAAGRRAPNGGGNRLDQAFVETPDGVRMEILEDKTQTVPYATNTSTRAAGPEVPKAVAWYATSSAGRQPRATTRRSSTCLACSCASTRPTRRRRRRATGC